MIKELLQDSESKKNYFIALAEDREEIVGGAIFRHITDDHIYIEIICTNIPRKKIGTNLMNLIERYIQNNLVNIFLIKMIAINNSEQFFIQLGYEKHDNEMIKFIQSQPESPYVV
jgi:hypothetical protein